MWCAPAPAVDTLIGRNPPSSDPWRLFGTYALDIRENDKGSAVIDRNRAGILRGAESKLADGVIDTNQHKIIQSMAAEASLDEFQPLFMVIPYDRAVSKQLVEKADIGVRARVTSDEYIIRNLPRDDFEVWS